MEPVPEASDGLGEVATTRQPAIMCPESEDKELGDAKLDRRVQRSKRALREALVRLMIEKGYEHISVADIAERADVGRSTFYAHYADKEDLLQESLQGLRSYLVGAAPQREPGSGPVPSHLAFSLPMLEHVRQMPQLFCALVGKRSGAPVQEQLHLMLTDLVRERLEADGTACVHPIPLVAEFIVGAFLAVCIWWMNGHQEIPAADIDRAFRSLVGDGGARLP